MAELKSTLRSVGWIALGVLVLIAAWVLGLATCLAQINSCTWAQRNGWVVFLAVSFIIVAGFFALHRLPCFNADEAIWRSQVFAGLLLFPWFIGAFACGPEMFGAIERGRQKRTMADMKSIAAELDDYHSRNGTYPLSPSLSQLKSVLDPQTSVPVRDGWGQPYYFQSNAAGYTLVSRSRCGRPEVADSSDYQKGETIELEADIVIVNGRFFRHPQGIYVEQD